MTSLHVDDAFLGHYQLSHDPFAAKVPGFKFFAAQRKPVLGQLHHLARYSQLLLVVSGPEGSGKTLLRQALVASANKQTVQSLVVSARNASTRNLLLAHIAQGLQSPLVSLQGIQERIGQLALTGQEVYLLVDDAEALADDAIAALMALASGGDEARAHVFLFAEQSLTPRLEAHADGDDRFHVIELAPYSEEETREYIALRLEGAGQDLSLLDEEQIGEIYERSEGWPGQINEVARDVLIEGMLAEREEQRSSVRALNLPKKHLLAVAVVLIGVIAAWFMQGRSTSEQPLSSSVVDLPLNGASVPLVNAQSPRDGANGAVDASQPSRETVGFTGGSESVPLALPTPSQPVMRQPLAEAAASGPEEDVVAPQSPVNLVPAPAPAPAPVPVPAVPKAVVQPAPLPVAQAPKPVVQAPVAPAASAANGAWHRSQPANNYSLQVFATAREATAQAYVAQYGNGYHYFQKSHQGQQLFVVTYGSFASEQAAKSAVSGLPQKVREAKPWPKTFASIRQEMTTSR